MKIYNTLTRQKEEFVPIEEGKAHIYTCGPTVYNYIHIGNARPMVVFDTLRRYMEFIGYDVKFVQNFTDVDDKIINKAKEDGENALAVSEKYIEEYFDDADALNVRRANVHPKVSEHIAHIIKFVQNLVDNGYAYEADGDVYFETRKFKEYGKLSRQNIDDLEAGARIAVGEVKKDPLDFALWKARKTDDEISWKSPWGEGRPGWHIECSAMAKEHLGETIDIHAGGEDLQFPHHENEIAQSESCNGAKFARYWMHNGFITIDRAKMSKSKGNFFTVRDIRKQYSGDEIRFFLLSGHYRGPIDFGVEHMEQARAGLGRISTCKQTLEFMRENAKKETLDEHENEILSSFAVYEESFVNAMDDDLNTADAISAIFELVTGINTALREDVSKEFCESALYRLKKLTDVLGILEKQAMPDKIEEDVEQLLKERELARSEKDWSKADAIRDKIKELGYTIKDTPQGAQVVKDNE